MWRKEKFVHLLGFSVSINKEPPLRGTFLAALQCGIQVLLSTMAAQRQPDPGEDFLVIQDQTTKIPEHASIRSNPESTFAQHGKTVERSDDIWVQVD
jgi:hypothetical protein